MHEITHAFDVFQGLYNHWKKPDTDNAYANHAESFSFNDGNTWSVLQIPAITNFLKEHLNCPSALGEQAPRISLFADNEHIVTKIFPLESIVSGYSFSDKRSLELALRLIAATGFWQVNYNRVEPFSFGKMLDATLSILQLLQIFMKASVTAQ